MDVIFALTVNYLDGIATYGRIQFLPFVPVVGMEISFAKWDVAMAVESVQWSCHYNRLHVDLEWKASSSMWDEQRFWLHNGWEFDDAYLNNDTGDEVTESYREHLNKATSNMLGDFILSKQGSSDGQSVHEP